MVGRDPCMASRHPKLPSGRRRGGAEERSRAAVALAPHYRLGFSLKWNICLLLLLKQIVLMSPRHAFYAGFLSG